MKKRNDEELDDLLDDEEFVDDEEDVVDEEYEDEILSLDDEEIEEEIDDEPKSKKGKKADKGGADGKKGKKKLSKGAVAGIVLGSIAAVVALAVLGVFVIWPMFAKKSVVAEDFEELLGVNGFQNPDAAEDMVKLKTGADDLVSVQEMCNATSWDEEADQARFAAQLYSLAITNYQQVAGTGWYCYTDSSVYATDVTAELGFLKPTFPKFKVGVRAAFGMGSLEADDPNDEQEDAEKDNFFSQTISGVTVLEIENISDTITGALKSAFGYNCQEYLYNGTYAYKRGPNGGANFYGASSDIGWKYMMGAYNADLFKEDGYEENQKNKDTGYPEWTYFSDEYDNELYGEAKAVNKIATPDNIIHDDEDAWGELDTIYNYAFQLKPYNEKLTYYYGNYGAGWAVYDFSYANLDKTKTTVKHKDGYWEINMVVKEDKMDAACMFAKGSLTKDTKDYIQLQSPVYSLKKNVIQIYDNGLIKAWERIEAVDSDLPARLTVLTGECKQGGGTENHTYMTFSYSPIDYHPQALAARYMPEIAKATNITSKWPTLANYDPKNKGTEYAMLAEQY